MVKININIQKKDLWLISAIAVFLVGSGIIIAFNPGLSGGDASIMGHSSDEILVDFNGSIRTLQDALNVIDGGGQFGGGGMSFGVWNDRDNDGDADSVAEGPTYRATTDGIVVAYGLAFGSSDDAAVFGYTNSNSNPTTLVAKFNSNSGNWDSSTMTFPVKSGDYWKVNSTAPSITVRWMPIVSGVSAFSSYTRTCVTDGCTISCDSGDVRTGCGMQSSGGAHNNDLTKAYPTSGESCTCDIYNNAGTCYAICLDTSLF